MPSRPPETRFYDDTYNVWIWQQVELLYEQVLGPDSKRWSEHEERFVTVLNDLHVRLRETPRRARVD